MRRMPPPRTPSASSAASRSTGGDVQYAVAIYKATQGFRVFTFRPDVMHAKLAAGKMLDMIELLLDMNTLASGVAILVLPEDYAVQNDCKGIILLDREKVLFQIGSY